MESAKELSGAKAWPSLTTAPSNTRGFYDRWPGLVIFFSIYALPIILLVTHVVPRSYAHDLLFIFLPILFVYGRLRRFSFLKLGFSPRWRSGLKENIVFSTVAMLGVAILYFLKLIPEDKFPEDGHFFIKYIFFSCPAQVFLYLGIPFAEMERRGFSKNTYILVSALNFAFLHAFYLSGLVLVVTFGVGLVWGWIYSNHQNFWACAISHMALGVLSIVAGLV